MHVVHINDLDLTGSRFNGFDLQKAMNKLGYPTYQLVFSKESDDSKTISLAPTAEEYAIRDACRRFEERLSLHALMYSFGKKIIRHEHFVNSEIVHCHIIHNHFFSLYDLQEISKQKSLVWTLHDPWALTGHCVHPINCTKWLTGCKDCPNLESYFPLKEDNSSLLWDIKKDIYKNLDVDIVVASRWMERLVRKSPLTKHFSNIHMIPFGVNLEMFIHEENRRTLREQLGIDDDDFVLLFRSKPSFFKGLDVILNMLKILQPTKTVVLLVIGLGDIPHECMMKYETIEIEWVNDEKRMAELYCISDVLLMPSRAESFGMMAVEAMASRRPVIVMEGTALPDVTFAPDCGICISKDRPVQELKEVIERLIENPEECRRRGEAGREIVKNHYRFDNYVNNHLELYDDIIKRKK
jgi:glycosyltransferase involved in cell wall biosynthesis